MSIVKRSIRLKPLLPPMLVFIIACAGYLTTPRSSQVYSDSRWSIHLALSVIREGNLNLDEYKRMITPGDYAIETIQGHQYCIYPIGAPLLAVPFVFVYNLINPHTFGQIGKIHPVAQEVIASFIVALTAVLVYLIARLSLTVKQSLLVAFIFAFCTSAWSTGTRALWQHGPTMLCLALALYLLLAARNRPWLAQFASIPLAYSFVIRPLNAVSILFLSLFVLLAYRKYFIRYVLWSCVITVPFFVINYTSFGVLLPAYYHSYGTFYIPTIKSLFGPWISPSRGLFIYTPLFLFSCFGFYLRLKNFRESYPQNILDLALGAIIVGNWLFVSAWWMWWGGYSIGPRMFLDMVPFWIYFLLPVIPRIAKTPKLFSPLRLAFAACLIFSFLIQFQGTRSDAMWGWNNVPTTVDLDQDRLWDWGDPQFLRGASLLSRSGPPWLRD